MELLLDGRLARALDTLDEGACRELFATFEKAGVRVTPTLVQLATFVEGGAAWRPDDPRLRLVRPAAVAQWRQHDAELGPGQREAGRSILAAHRRLTVALQAAGVGVLAGTDASDEPWLVAGDSLHEELAIFAAAGMSPLEALRTATLNPVRMLQGPQADPLAPGAAADLVLLRADPLVDIHNTRQVDSVILRGRLLDRNRLDALLREVEEIVARQD